MALVKRRTLSGDEIRKLVFESMQARLGGLRSLVADYEEQNAQKVILQAFWEPSLYSMISKFLLHALNASGNQ